MTCWMPLGRFVYRIVVGSRSGTGRSSIGRYTRHVSSEVSSAAAVVYSFMFDAGATGMFGLRCATTRPATGMEKLNDAFVTPGIARSRSSD